jgi:transposase
MKASAKTLGSVADLQRLCETQKITIIELNDKILVQDAKIFAQDAEILAQDARILALEAKLNRNSSNSSNPPSKDPPGNPAAKKKKKNRKKRKRGGQPGRKAAHREMLPADKTENIVPSNCHHCAAQLYGRDPEPKCTQVIEVPPIKPTVTDYLCHTLDCENCGKKTIGSLPIEARGGVFGPRLSSLVGLLSGKFRMTKRLTQEVLSDVLGVTLALGSVCNIERRLSTVLEPPVTQAREFVRQQPVVHADETSWCENKAKAWLWIAACPLVATFFIATSRGAAVAKELLGELFEGVAVTDRWSGYGWLSVWNRQICWSHLIRDFQSWVDGGGVGQELGEALLLQTHKMFKWWHQVRHQKLPRSDFIRRMRSVQLEVAFLLTKAQTCGDPRVQGMAKNLLGVEQALWTFVAKSGVEPTNNFGEGIIRKAVIWRKVCFGTDSVQGSRFAERIMTTVTTLKLQKRNVLEYLTEAYVNSLAGTSAPSLLPAGVTSLPAQQRLAA